MCLRGRCERICDLRFAMCDFAASNQPRAAASCLSMANRKSQIANRVWPLGFILLLSFSTAHAAWWESGWAFRRPIDVTWDSERGGGDELAEAEFLSAGHHKPDGSDVRVATADGKLVPSRVLMVGPGDRVRIVFALARPARNYFVYFGNPDPAPPPKGVEDVSYRCGLLMEMRQWSGGSVDNIKEVERSWDRSQPVIGRKMIERPFLGVNPFGEQRQTISKISGWCFAPVDGAYTFAASAGDRGALYVDGQPLVFARGPVWDIRFNATVNLKRGRHEFLFYHVNTGGEGRFTVGWRRPDMQRVDVMGRDAFGFVLRGQVGALEEFRKALTADFKAEYLGECFFANHYSHRYRFTASGPKRDNAKYEWDFGDGQTAAASEVEHVYLRDGVYEARLRVSIGTNGDTQTSRIGVSRDYERLDRPPTDEPPIHSKIVAGYDVAKMPSAWLGWAVSLHERARQPEAMLAVARRLGSEEKHADPSGAIRSLQDATTQLLSQKQAEQALHLWESVPGESDLQPEAGRQRGQLLLWWTADFSQAVKVLEPLAKANADLKRLYAQALILGQQAPQGGMILEQLPMAGNPDRQAAMSGALARTIEYFIREGDWESGEETWEKWQTQYPGEFVEGYSVLLRVRLMEIRKMPLVAAKVAQAFATALPKSSYAPQLLMQASRLLADSDPAKSNELKQLLKQRYPEDPLSQE